MQQGSQKVKVAHMQIRVQVNSRDVEGGGVVLQACFVWGLGASSVSRVWLSLGVD